MRGRNQTGIIRSRGATENGESCIIVGMPAKIAEITSRLSPALVRLLLKLASDVLPNRFGQYPWSVGRDLVTASRIMDSQATVRSYAYHQLV